MNTSKMNAIESSFAFAFGLLQEQRKQESLREESFDSISIEIDSIGTIDDGLDFESDNFESAHSVETACIPTTFVRQVSSESTSEYHVPFTSAFGVKEQNSSLLEPIHPICDTSTFVRNVSSSSIDRTPSVTSKIAKTVSFDELHGGFNSLASPKNDSSNKKTRISDFLKSYRRPKRNSSNNGKHSKKRTFLESTTSASICISNIQNPVLHATNKRQRTALNACAKGKLSSPVNIAIKANSSLDLIRRVLDVEGPNSIAIRDGPDECSALHFAIKQSPNNADLANLLLSSNQRCAQIVDRRGNTPLHIACGKGASLDVIECLYQVYPDALLHRNFYNETPLCIAQKRTALFESDNVLNYLQGNFDQTIEEKLQNDLDW